MGEETQLLFDLQGARERPKESPVQFVGRHASPRGVVFSFEVCPEVRLDEWVHRGPACVQLLPSLFHVHGCGRLLASRTT